MNWGNEDLGATELHTRNISCTNELLKLLKLHHGVPEPEPVVEEPAVKIEAAIRALIKKQKREADAKSRARQVQLGAARGEEIIKAVCIYFDISRIDLISPRRDREVHNPRMVAMWLCRRLTTSGYPTLGRLFERDHTSVIHSCRKMDLLISKRAPEGIKALYLKQLIADEIAAVEVAA